MFNNVKFLEDVREVHLLSNEELAAFEAVTDVRNRLNDMALCGFIGDELALIRKSLDDICANFVGETMFRLLVSKMNPQKLKIINIGPEEAGEEPVEQNGSSYGNGEVLINLNLYENETGTGIKERQYYFVDQYGIPLKKLKSVANSLFHEFTHCLHDAENSDLYSLYCQPPGEKDPNEEYIVWSNSEEERTIAGFIPPNTYDPICENCFDLCNTVAQRTKYRPRIGHFGYQKGIVEYRDVVLIPLYRGLPFKLDWPIKYGHA